LLGVTTPPVCGPEKPRAGPGLLGSGVVIEAVATLATGAGVASAKSSPGENALARSGSTVPFVRPWLPEPFVGDAGAAVVGAGPRTIAGGANTEAGDNGGGVFADAAAGGGVDGPAYWGGLPSPNMVWKGGTTMDSGRFATGRP